MSRNNEYDPLAIDMTQLVTGTVPDDEAPKRTGKVVNAKLVNLRSEPTSTATPIYTLAEGMTVEILADMGNFYKITVDHKTGWVAKKYVEE